MACYTKRRYQAWMRSFIIHYNAVTLEYNEWRKPPFHNVNNNSFTSICFQVLPFISWFRFNSKNSRLSYKIRYDFFSNNFNLINKFIEIPLKYKLRITSYLTLNRLVRYFLFQRNQITIFNRYVHPFHIVNPSPWPFLVSLGVFIFVIGLVLYFNFYEMASLNIKCGLLLFLSCAIFWWRDVIRESTFEGYHTKAVQKGLKIGMLLFILSEIMFFLAFFWAFFHSSLSPAIEIGGIWPPLGIQVLNPWKMPLLNTMYLLASGVWITWAHYEMTTNVKSNIARKQCLYQPHLMERSYKMNSKLFKKVEQQLHQKNSLKTKTLFNLTSKFDIVFSGILGTIAFGLLFTFTQWGEYDEAFFNISDGIYGSLFYMATGFHGFHVLIGTTFLIICLIRYFHYHFTRQHHVGFEAAVWYWHFVDVVWLFLYVCVYHWGG